MAKSPAPGRPEMVLGAAVDAPDGFIALCVRSPVDCTTEDTPVVRARVALEARALARARWTQVIEQAQARGEVANVVTASIRAPSAHSAELVEASAPTVGLDALAQEFQVSETPPQASDEFPAPAPTAPKSYPPLRLTGGVRFELAQVNQYVNRAIARKTDQGVYGVDDWWAAPLAEGRAAVGDCEDFVLEKRRELIARGVPAENLSIALVKTSWGEAHAVLLVATDEGDLVLDSLRDRIEPWSRVKYRWMARQAPGDPMTWMSVADEGGQNRRG